ncbi:MAG TPA: S41 family peptidase [Vicinamibacterales bacterium]|nr:S41 family peptidase [Vicinamibacterales bacterium]
MRKAPLVLLAITLASVASPAAAGTPGRFMQYPDISGNAIVFSWDRDLWSVPASGGVATRLTGHPGVENVPKFSPDGTQIAFAGQYEGNNLYVMPATGGAPRRITFVGAGLQTVGWTPDGTRVIFRSGHENTFRPIVKLYTVAASGGLPEQMPMERGILCSFSPDGTRLAYNRRGNEEYYWKRYKGGQYTDIWLYDFTANTYAPLTDYVGKNAYPMWIGNRLYFVSDRSRSGIANLFTYDFTTKKVDQVTDFADFDVQMPETDGRSIVFVQAGWLHVLDAATNKVRRVEVEMPSDRWGLADRTINPRAFIHAMTVSNDGRTAVFEARGDIFAVSTDDSRVPRNLTRTPGTRERFPQISPDGTRVAFYSDRTGDYQIYVTDVGGDKPWEPLTTDLDRCAYHLEWSPDGSKILFGNKDFSIFYLDLATKKLVKVASSNQMKNDEFFWEVSDYSWSPDGKWIAYSFVEFNRNNRVFLYSLEQGRSFPLTNGFYDSLNPSFDAGGEYLYFLSYRDFSARMDIFEDNHVIPSPVQVMAVQLRAGQAPPFGKGAPRTAEARPFRIDLAGIDERVFPLPVRSGNYFFLKAGKGVVTWASTDSWGESEYETVFSPSGEDKWTLNVFDMASQKLTVSETTISDWRLSLNREQAIVRKGAAYFVGPTGAVAASKGFGTALNLDQMAYRVQAVPEWTQIFNDAWRWYRDFFYDPNMHGRDWKRIGDKFRAMIPELNNRSDLNWLLSQMVGELCVSHTYVSGGDFGPAQLPPTPVFTGLLGADIRADASGYPRLARILGPTAYNRDLAAPLARPDIDVKDGDFLIAVDGHDLKGDTPYRHLQVTRGQKVTVTVNGLPSAAGAKTYEVEPIPSESDLRYHRWVADNIAAVEKASAGQLGYMHITAMGSSNTGQFDKYWRAFRDRKGLVIDVRGNGGGWTEYFIIDKLERKMTAHNVLRGMAPFRYPGSITTGPIAVLTNEYNGSDGEAFLEHFKARKLGTVIGVPSWGGLVGILNGQTTIDNGTIQQSNNAFYNDKGQWLVENHGADPDILLENDPASASAGRDLQLEKAIEVLLAQIKEKPFTWPPVPKYPIR